jgi:uncharacterized membrane protein (UPF0127 family)
VTDESWEQRLAGLAEEPLDGALTMVVARSYGERRRGLARMAPLPDDRGLRILRCNSVHTFGMRFALDLVWLGADGSVVRVDREVPPRRHRWCRRAAAVVETKGGESARFLAAGLGYTARR